MLLAVPSVVAQVDSAITRSGEVGAYDGTRADFLTVSGKLSRYPRLSKAGKPLHYAPIVTTDSVPVSNNTATVYGNIVFNGWYDQLTAQGFQLSTSSDFSNATDYPTPVNTYVECDQPCAANVFSVTISNLTPGAIYYVRAYATNEAGTTYSDALIFLVESTGACPGTPTVTDHQGNVYTTVQIGHQCWTRQNMRCTSLPSNPNVELEITNSSSGNLNIPMAYFGRGELDLEKLGYRYNWPAAMDTTFTSTTNDRFEKRRGICPEGWHVPSLDEWNILLDYLKAHGDIYGCGGDSTLTAKALASTTGWSEYSSDCAIGNNPESNNASGFTAYPGTNIDEIRVWTSTSYYHNTSTNPSYAFYLDMSNSSSSPRIENCQKSYGNSVRCVRDTTGLRVPSLTATVDNVTQETASVLSAVTADGGAEITERGICWSTDTLPTIDNYRMVDTTGENIGLGDYISQITTLTPSLTYHVRAYAINFEGVGYSEDVTFTTPSPSNLCEGTPTVTDHEGNVYNTVKIGYQCWTRENMRCTTSPDGTEIGFGGGGSSDYIRCGDTLALYYDDYASAVPLEQRGYHYNWYAVMDTVSKTASIPYVSFEKRRGICPEGWHIPSITEWDTLVNYMSRQSEYMCRVDAYSKYFANALASKSWWAKPNYSDSCYVGVNPENNNASGMSMIPTGYWYSGGFRIDKRSEDAYFWSSTLYSNSSSYNYGFRLRYDVNRVSSRSDYGDQFSRGSAFPVRCLRDTTGLYVPTVSATLDTVTSTTATISASVTKDGGETVTERGVCYNTEPNPTIYNAKAVQGGGLGDFSTTIAGLVPNTTYYVRAYAKNYEGVGYSDEMVVTTPAPESACPGTPTVTDHEGNVYNTVQIGDQCWTRENMRCVTTPKNPSQSLMTTCSGWSCTSNYEPHVYSPFSTQFSNRLTDESLLNMYGYLYNWTAAMDTTSTTYIMSSFENRRGICPEGWHIPSITEWQTLSAYVSNQEDYLCDNNSTYIARALADQSSWNSNTSSCCVGLDLTQNNATGFSAVATGYIGDNSGPRYYSPGNSACFWSSSLHIYSTDIQPYYTSINYTNADFNDDNYRQMENGFSVRCIKNAPGTVEKTNPKVVTTGVSEITATSVKFTGEVTSDGNATVTQRGFCWGSTTSNLDTNHTHAAYGTGEGVFEATVSDFLPGYTYYVRAYAVNSLGITYGEQMSFTLTNDFHVDAVPYVTDFSDVTSWALGDNGNESHTYWTVGENNGYYTGKSLFVTQNGTTASCNNASYTSLYLSAEKYLKIPVGDSVHVEFDVLAGGYRDYHYMKAFLAPVSYTFTSNSNYYGSSTSTHAVDFQKYMLKNSSCYYISETNGKMLHVSVDMPNPATTANDTCKLAFLWCKAPYSTFVQPGAVVANVIVSTASAATDSVTQVTTSSAKVSCKTSTFGSETITERGVCWATHTLPLVSDNKVVSGSGAGAFDVNLTSLDFNTPYYVRAYAKTSTGLTLYGDEFQFRTKMSAEGYNTLPYSTDFTDGNKWVINNGDAENYWTMGVPTGESGSKLYITNDEHYAGTTGYNTSSSNTVVTAEKPLVMPNADSVYVSFDVKIGGESYYDFIKVFLTPEEFEIPAYFGSIPNNSISRHDSSRYAMDFGYSVIASGYSNTYYPYKLNLTKGNVFHVGAWMQNPAPGDTAKLVFLWRNNSNSGQQPGAVISNLSVTLSAPAAPDRTCPGTPTVTDEENNTYGTVLIGGQCWMAENLRSTRRGTYTVADTMYPNSDPTLAATYGLLYTWADVMQGEPSSNAFPSGVQGICPDGWHVPSQKEWKNLFDSVKANSYYVVGSSTNYIAKAMAHQEGWANVGYSDPAYPAVMPQYNNQTGFGARPAGCYYEGSIGYFGEEADFWTSTESSSSAYRAKLAYQTRNEDLNTRSKAYGYALRCVKDMDIHSTGYIMPANSSHTLTACDTMIFDDGGEYGDYSASNDSYLTIYPATPGMAVSISGTVTTETGYDFLYIYDGTDVNGDLLESYSGSSTITNVVSSTGPLTIHFHSDNSTVYGGFALTASCVDACLAPSGLTVSNIGTSSAELSWTPNGNETYWLVRYKEASSSDWDNEDFVSTPSYDLSNLTPLTAYEVSVQSVCGSELSNFASISFSTANCEPSEQCTYTFLLMDSYGDDWNGGYLEVVQDGVVVNTLEAQDGGGNGQTIDNVSVILCKNISTSLVWHSGNYDDEVGITLLGFGGDTLYSKNDMSDLTYDTLYTFTTNCDNVTPTTFTCGTSTVQDKDGNEYNTVLIGSQCWMKENLRTTTYADNTPINNDDFTYVPDNEYIVETYGYLYSWYAMMNGADTSNTNPSGVQGICPTGWHVPSDAEFEQLRQYLSENGFDCNGNLAKTLAANTVWAVSSTPSECTPAYSPSSNNSSGFSAYPAGYYSSLGPSFQEFPTSAIFWTCSEVNGSDVIAFFLTGSEPDAVASLRDKTTDYFSVRCVKN